MNILSEKRAELLIDRLENTQAKMRATLGKGLIPDAHEIAESLSGNGDVKATSLASNDVFETGCIQVNEGTSCKLNALADFTHILVCVDGSAKLFYALEENELPGNLCPCHRGDVIIKCERRWLEISLSKNECVRVEARRIHRIESENGAKFVYIVVRSN